MFICNSGIGYAIRHEDGLFIYHCLTSASVGKLEKGIDEIIIMK